MSRWLSFGHLLLLSQIIFTLRSCVIPGLSGNLLRQRLQHRALAASQPCTGKCALTLQPTAAFHHRHPRLRPGILSCLWQGARRALWGGTPRSAQPPEAAYSGDGAISPNCCTSIGLLRPSSAGYCAPWAEIDGWRTSIGLLRPSRGYDRAAIWRNSSCPIL